MLNCCHSLCKLCTDKQTRMQQDDMRGMHCPVCNAFTPDKTIESSCFLNELLDLYNDLTLEEVECEYCLGAEAEWKCLDCKLDLCTKCKEGHIRVPLLKTHKIVHRENVGELCVDQIMFCPSHSDEPIKFSCQECGTPICVKCKITKHDHHKTETIQETVEKLVYNIAASTSDVAKRIVGLDDNITILVEYKDSLKKKFKRVKEEASANLNTVIQIVQEEHAELAKHLDNKEEQELALLDGALKEKQDKKKQFQQILDWVNLCVDSATGVTLMTEIQGSLLQKLQTARKETTPEVIKLDFPALEFNKKQEKVYSGEVKYTTQFISGNKIALKRGVRFPENFSTLKPIDTYSLSDRCTRMSLINRMIWCPIPIKHEIEVFSLSGSYSVIDMRNKVQNPRAVQQAANGDILLASDSGIHLLRHDGSIAEQLTTGKFSDISTDGDIAVALNYNTSEVYTFRLEGNDWTQEYKFTTCRSFDNREFTILCDNENHCVYLSDSTSVTRYSMTGVEEKYICGLRFPFLCHIGEEGQVILADCCNYTFKRLDQKNMELSIPAPGAYPFSYICISYEEIWILNGDNPTSQLTKYGL